MQCFYAFLPRVCFNLWTIDSEFWDFCLTIYSADLLCLVGYFAIQLWHVGLQFGNILGLAQIYPSGKDFWHIFYCLVIRYGASYGSPCQHTIVGSVISERN